MMEFKGSREGIKTVSRKAAKENRPSACLVKNFELLVMNCRNYSLFNSKLNTQNSIANAIVSFAS